MRIIDAHCHLESEELRDNLATLVRDAHTAGLVKLITSSVTPEEWPLSRAIAQRFEEVEFALGIHPWYVTEASVSQLGPLADSKANGAVAIGEIGLDKKVSSPSLELQRDVLTRQLDIARQLHLPVVVHCRGAFDELLQAVKRVGVSEAGGLIHAFSGSLEQAELCIKLGFRFSFGRSLTYRNSPKRESIVRRLYPYHILLETDSPDTPPVGAAPGPNVPANIRLVLRAAAEMLGRPEADVAKQTTQNACQLFKLKVT